MRGMGTAARWCLNSRGETKTETVKPFEICNRKVLGNARLWACDRVEATALCTDTLYIPHRKTPLTACLTLDKLPPPCLVGAISNSNISSFPSSYSTACPSDASSRFCGALTKLYPSRGPRGLGSGVGSSFGFAGLNKGFDKVVKESVLTLPALVVRRVPEYPEEIQFL